VFPILLLRYFGLVKLSQIMIVSIGDWFLGTAVPALQVGSERVGLLFETTTGLVKRGDHSRESRMNYAALATVILFILLAVLMSAIHYTAGILITLTSVEDPPAVYLPLGQNDHKAAAVLGIDIEERKYITSSLFGTLRHLRSEGGFFALWRGLNAHMFYLIASLFINGACQVVFGRIFPGFLTRVIGSLIASLALARFAMVCTHIIISKPQSATWLTRLRSTPWSTARKTLPALASATLLVSLSREFIHCLATAGVDVPTRIIVILITCLLFLGIILPASVALSRVQASHLPEDAEPIVPFDRSFGMANDGDLTFTEAWKSMGMHGWKRVARMFMKLAPVMVVLPFVFICGVAFLVVSHSKGF